MITLTTRKGFYPYVSVLASLAPFKTHGSLCGEPTSLRSFQGYSAGRLPTEYTDSVNDADYVIFSYATPIAWHTPSGWVVPDVKYSVSTSKQQTLIRAALTIYSTGHDAPAEEEPTSLF